MKKNISQFTFTLIFFFTSIFGFASAFTMSGGGYSLESNTTAISGSASQGGQFTSSSASAPVAGVFSGGAFSGFGTNLLSLSSSQANTNSSSQPSGGGGGGIMAEPDTNLVTGLSVIAHLSSADISFSTNKNTSAALIYSDGAKTYATPLSKDKTSHAFSLTNLIPGRPYNFSIDLRVSGPFGAKSTLLGPYIFTTAKGSEVSVANEKNTISPFTNTNLASVNSAVQKQGEPKNTFVKVRGNIVDSNGKPIGNAQVTVFQKDKFGKYKELVGGVKFYSDNSGNYNLNLKSGSYLLKFKKDGYSDFMTSLDTNKDAQIYVVLNKLQKEIQPIGEDSVSSGLSQNKGEKSQCTLKDSRPIVFITSIIIAILSIFYAVKKTNSSFDISRVAREKQLKRLAMLALLLASILAVWSFGSFIKACKSSPSEIKKEQMQFNRL